MAGIGENVAFGSGQLHDNIIAQRNLNKCELAGFIRGIGQESVFMSELLGVLAEEAKLCVGENNVLSVDFGAMNSAEQKLVYDGIAVVQADLNNRLILSRVLEAEVVLCIVLHIVRIAGKLLGVVLAEGQVCGELNVTVLVRKGDLNETVDREDRTILGNNVLSGIETKGDARDFSVQTDAEGVAGLQFLFCGNTDFLTIIDKACLRGSEGYLLPSVVELDLLRLGVENAACGSLDLDHLVSAKVKLLGGSRAVLAGRDLINNSSGFSTQGSVARVDVLGCDDLIGSASQTAQLIDRSIYTVDQNGGLAILVGGDSVARNIYSRKHLAGLAYTDGSFLRLVVHGDRNDISAILIFVAGFGHSKRNGGAVEDIAIWGLDFNQRVVSNIQNLRGEQGAVCAHIEGVDGGRLRVGVAHLHELTIGIIDLESRAGQGDRLAGFFVCLDDLDERRIVGVVDQVLIVLSVLCHEDSEVRHELRLREALGLMYGIDAIGQEL